MTKTNGPGRPPSSNSRSPRSCIFTRPWPRELEQLRLIQEVERRVLLQEVGDAIADGRRAHQNRRGAYSALRGAPAAAADVAVVAGAFHRHTRGAGSDRARVRRLADTLGPERELDHVPLDRAGDAGAAEGPLVVAGQRLAVLHEDEHRFPGAGVEIDHEVPCAAHVGLRRHGEPSYDHHAGGCCRNPLHHLVCLFVAMWPALALSILAHVSRNVTVRLITSRSSVESGSTQT